MLHLPTGTVTLLFTDIEGSTRLLQQLGERFADLLAECRQLLRTAFHQWQGHEVDTQGDAFFVAFARASDAVAAAVDGQRALASHNWPEGVSVRVRMGLHTGEPHLASDGYVGLDVHRAARIMSAGHGGQVLLSRTTSDLVELALPEGVSLLDLGTHRLKDLQQSSQLLQLVITGLAADFPQLKTLDSYPNNLPIQPTPFIGREKEVVAIQQKLLRQDVCLVTLTGPGGVGKTRLALQVAAESSEHFADGTWFVSLAPLTDPDLVIPTIIQTLGLREAQDQSSLEHLKDALHEKKMLLLLDNFEQVVSAAIQVADLLTVCPRLKVLVTSREVLHVRAEHEQRLFQRLSVFVGGCTWQAIEAVSATFGDDTSLVFDRVASLIHKNLLRQTVSEGEELRLTMLETIREYGQECLATSREMDTTREAHAAYYLALAEEATRGFKGRQQAEWLERLDREHDNVRATLAWMLELAQAGPGIEKALRLSWHSMHFGTCVATIERRYLTWSRRWQGAKELQLRFEPEL